MIILINTPNDSQLVGVLFGIIILSFGNDIVFGPQVRNINIHPKTNLRQTNIHPKTDKIRCYERYWFNNNLLGQVVYCFQKISPLVNSQFASI